MSPASLCPLLPSTGITSAHPIPLPVFFDSGRVLGSNLDLSWEASTYLNPYLLLNLLSRGLQFSQGQEREAVRERESQLSSVVESS